MELVSDGDTATPWGGRKDEVSICRGFIKRHDAKPERMYVEDLAALEHLTEDGILEELRHRSAKGFPYTFVGDVLVSINSNEMPAELPRSVCFIWLYSCLMLIRVCLSIISICDLLCVSGKNSSTTSTCVNPVRRTHRTFCASLIPPTRTCCTTRNRNRSSLLANRIRANRRINGTPFAICSCWAKVTKASAIVCWPPRMSLIV